ncbi:cilium assembly protein DZIP1L [Colius striatus]|uniref:cilium assembly protein DZIP1L n=1 Tax=Colius striatus TaxID=57412 RepID=UPI002B1D5623|nr:cilium assembly protein DZIP1L [Colius striatus]
MTFQPRRVAVDWRRFGAVDVERVAREVDVAVLQEHITSVTFCDLAGERCPHCRQPADPILLKVLRMAQLSIEYLLHCQESLGTSLALHAQRLGAAQAELARTQQRAAEQEAQLRGAKEESRGWKKLIATQQLLLQAGPRAHCKCQLCHKAFLNGSLLQAHVQHWHPEPTDLERWKVKQVERMEAEVEELTAELQETRRQLEAEREAEKLHREQEAERARQREEEGRRDLERWKDEERMKLHEELDGLRKLLLTAFKDVAHRSSAMEEKLQELHAREVVMSNLGTLCDDDRQEPQWWAARQAELQGEQGRTAVQVKLVSASKPKATQGVTKVVADEESSARREATLGKKHRLLEALQTNPNLLKQFHPILEEVLEEKLESMGVKRAAKGISTRTYKRLQAVLRLQQQQKTQKFPGLLHLRDELVRAVVGKVRQCMKPSTALPPQLSIIPAQSLKTPRLLGGPQPMVMPAAGGAEAAVIPQPVPRSRAHSTHHPSRTHRGTLQPPTASSTS